MVLLTIVDYGLGNLRSVQRALEGVGARVQISSSRPSIKESDGLILPGVGAFKDAVENVASLRDEIVQMVNGGKPILGICLGLQLLFTESTEGGLFEGFNVFEGSVERFPRGVKVPHVGWNSIKIIKECPLVEGIPSESYVYFAHSYQPNPKERGIVVAETFYGVVFPSIVSKNSVYDTQFHPEKSVQIGLKILENFVKIVKR